MKMCTILCQTQGSIIPDSKMCHTLSASVKCVLLSSSLVAVYMCTAQNMLLFFSPLMWSITACLDAMLITMVDKL